MKATSFPSGALFGLVLVAGLGMAAAASAQIAPRILAWDEAIQATDGIEVRWPVALASGAADELAVADAGESRLLILHDGERRGAWRQVRTVALPGSPVGLVAHAGRYVLSLRGPAGLIAVEGPEAQIRELPLPADVVPGALATTANRELLVYDSAGRRVLFLDSRGGVSEEVTLQGHLTALAGAPGGGFYAATPEPAEILRYTAAGDLVARWPVPGVAPTPAWPSALAVEPGGDLLLADRHGCRLLVLEAGGQLVGTGARRGWDGGLLMFPSGLARLADGRIAIADLGNGRVQIFQRTDRNPTP